MKIYYCVEVPLLGSEGGWFTVARALEPDAAAELVRVLLRCGQTGPQIIRIRVEIVD